MFRLLSLFLLLPLCACTTNEQGVEIKEQPTPRQDSAYFDKYLSSTKKAKVYVDFETRLLISATHLSPAFTQAFSDRIKKLFEDIPFSLNEANSKTGFFVSIYAPESEKNKLEDSGIWNIRYKTEGNIHTPVAIKKIEDKFKWQAFFPSINDWTTEYLVVFDSIPFTPNNPQMVDQKSFELTLAGIDTRVSLKW